MGKKKKPEIIEVKAIRIEEGEPLPTGPEVISQAQNPDALMGSSETSPSTQEEEAAANLEKSRAALEGAVDHFGRRIKSPLLRALWEDLGKGVVRKVTTPRRKRRPGR